MHVCTVCVCVHVVVRTNSCKIVCFEVVGACEVQFPTSSQLGPCSEC